MVRERVKRVRREPERGKEKIAAGRGGEDGSVGEDGRGKRRAEQRKRKEER